MEGDDSSEHDDNSEGDDKFEDANGSDPEKMTNTENVSDHAAEPLSQARIEGMVNDVPEDVSSQDLAKEPAKLTGVKYSHPDYDSDGDELSEDEGIEVDDDWNEDTGEFQFRTSYGRTQTNRRV